MYAASKKNFYEELNMISHLLLVMDFCVIQPILPIKKDHKIWRLEAGQFASYCNLKLKNSSLFI